MLDFSKEGSYSSENHETIYILRGWDSHEKCKAAAEKLVESTAAVYFNFQ